MVAETSVGLSRVLTTPDFLDRFTQKAETSTSRVGYRTMSYVEDGAFASRVTDKLVRKAALGVRTVFSYDGSSLVCPDGHVSIKPPMFRQLSSEALDHAKDTQLRLLDLSAAGVSVLQRNELNLLRSVCPFLFSDHTKAAVTDDTAWIMSCNLTQAHLEQPSVAYETQNPQLVDYIDKLFFDPNYEISRDAEVSFPPDEQLLVDAGRGESVIMEYGVSLAIKPTDRLVLMSQLLPDGLLMHELVRAAKRGVEVVIVTSANSTDKYSKQPYKFFYSHVEKDLSGQKNLHIVRTEGFMLAKMFFSDTELIIGSSNFSCWGPSFCTKEADIVTGSETALVDARKFAGQFL